VDTPIVPIGPTPRDTRNDCAIFAADDEIGVFMQGADTGMQGKDGT
jgi:hypothetical protein